MFNNQVRQRVRGLVAGIGPSIVSNPDLLETKLADLNAENGEDVRLIVAAARAGIPEEIASAPVEHRAELTEQAATWMAGETGASAEAAKWAVETWAAALEGVKIEPKPETAPALQPAVLTPPPLNQSPLGYGSGAPPAPWDTPNAPPPQPSPWGTPPPPPGGPWQNQGYGGQPSGAWPPPSQRYGPMSEGDTSYDDDGFPMAISRLKWNWGAFGVTFWWFIFHGMWPVSVGWFFLPGLLRLLPGGLWVHFGLLFAAQVAAGLLGNKLAWQNRSYDSVQHFFEVERIWMIWGIALTVLYVLFWVVIILWVASLVHMIAGK